MKNLNLTLVDDISYNKGNEISLSEFEEEQRYNLRIETEKSRSVYYNLSSNEVKTLLNAQKYKSKVFICDSENGIQPRHIGDI